MKLGIVATHPIQYQVPWYRALADRNGIDLKVYYALLPTAEQQGVGFDTSFDWDLPLLDGYDWKQLPNTARRPSLRGFLSSRTPAVREVLARDRPEAVVLTGWHSLPLVQALWACRREGIPIVMRAESNALKPRPWWVRVLHRALLSRVDAFLAIGAANRDFYLGYGVDPKRIFAAPYFVDNERFLTDVDRLRERRRAWRQEWEVGEEDICFVFVGKLVQKKRVMDFLKALDRARSAGARTHGLVVGTGAEMEEARSFARSANVSVTFAGFLNQTEIGRAYAVADCLVLPSDFGETWGLVVNEAMVHGLPAIVSDRVGCGPDLVVEGETGWTFPCGDVEILAELMAHLAGRPRELEEAGRKARERVRMFSVERGVQGTLEALSFVAEARGGSA